MTIITWSPQKSSKPPIWGLLVKLAKAKSVHLESCSLWDQLECVLSVVEAFNDVIDALLSDIEIGLAFFNTNVFACVCSKGLTIEKNFDLDDAFCAEYCGNVLCVVLIRNLIFIDNVLGVLLGEFPASREVYRVWLYDAEFFHILSALTVEHSVAERGIALCTEICLRTLHFSRIDHRCIFRCFKRCINIFIQF